MEVQPASPDWFDRVAAVLFATIVVLGLAIMVLALVVYFPGSGGSDLPLP